MNGVLWSLQFGLCKVCSCVFMRASSAKLISDYERCTMGFALLTLQSIDLLFLRTSSAGWVFECGRGTMDFALWALQSIPRFFCELRQHIFSITSGALWTLLFGICNVLSCFVVVSVVAVGFVMVC